MLCDCIRPVLRNTCDVVDAIGKRLAWMQIQALSVSTLCPFSISRCLPLSCDSSKVKAKARTCQMTRYIYITMYKAHLQCWESKGTRCFRANSPWRHTPTLALDSQGSALSFLSIECKARTSSGAGCCRSHLRTPILRRKKGKLVQLASLFATEPWDGNLT